MRHTSEMGFACTMRHTSDMGFAGTMCPTSAMGFAGANTVTWPRVSHSADVSGPCQPPNALSVPEVVVIALRIRAIATVVHRMWGLLKFRATQIQAQGA